MFLQQAPAQFFTGAQRDNVQLAEWQAGRGGPFFTNQGDAIGVGRQTVEARAVEAGKRFELVQRITLFERFGIQLDGGVRGVAAGAAAGGFLGVLGVRRRIGAEEELRAAAGGGVEQGFLMGIALEDRQAVEVRPDPPTSMWLRLYSR